jgi:pimeloyl-ACP methyl ester carboxylesterase
MVVAEGDSRGGGGIWKVPFIVGGASTTFPDRKDPRHFLFFPRTTEGKNAANAYFARLAERRSDLDTPISRQAGIAQVRAITSAGLHRGDDLSQIKIPVLVANGDNDLMVASEHSKDMAARLPDSRLRIYPDSGHGGVFQYHHEFVPEVLDFLGAS